MSRALPTGPVPLRRELPPWAAGLLTIGSTALALFAGLLVAVAALGAAAVMAARALIDLV